MSHHSELPGAPEVDHHPPPSVRELCAAILLFVAATALLLGPAMGWRLSGILGPDHGDPLLYVYLMKWTASRLPHGLAGFWDPPFFYPMRGVLALSDHLLGPGLAFSALRAVGVPALAGYNLLYAGQFAAAGVAAWWVLRRSGISFSGAAFGAWFFTFGHYRWDEQSHFNVLLVAAVPLVLWTFDRLLDRPDWRRALFFLVAYALHLSGGTYLAYLVHVPLLVLALHRLPSLRSTLRRRRAALAPLGGAAAICLALLAVLFTGYASRAGGLGAERNLRDLRLYSSTLASFASASAKSPLERFGGILPVNAGRGALVVGPALAVAAWIGLIAGWRRHRRPIRRRSWPLAAGSLLGGILVALALGLGDEVTLHGKASLAGLDSHGYRGPLLLFAVGVAAIVLTQRRLRDGAILRWRKLDPWTRGLLVSGLVSGLLCLAMFFWLPWSALPGLRGARVSHRFFSFAALAVGLLAGRGFDAVRRSISGPLVRTSVLALLCGIAVAENRPDLRHWTPMPEERDFPAYSGYLAGAEDVRAYLQLPFFGKWLDLRTMYLGSGHWKPMINGSSSYMPTSYERLADSCESLEPDCLETLQELRVSHLVLAEDSDSSWRPVHQKEAQRRIRHARSRIFRLVRSGLLTPVFEAASGSVFRFNWPDRPPAAREPPAGH